MKSQAEVEGHETDVHWQEALHEARDKYGSKPWCLGIDYGAKRKNGKFTGAAAVVIYVRKKWTLEELKNQKDVQPIDAELCGCQTDVVEPFSAKRPKRHLDYIADHQRSHDLAALDYGRIHREHEAAHALPDISGTDVVGEVFLIEDANGRLITIENGEEVLDIAGAYEDFRDIYGDNFDFVTFFSDTASGMPTFNTSFHWGLFNDIEGIRTFKRGTFDDRADVGGSNKLQSILFMHNTQLNRYTILQEVGHRWCAFPYFRENKNGPDRDDLLIPPGNQGAGSHWSILFDDDVSPVDYDYYDWRENADGTFDLILVPDESRRYCNLDLYLMGLIPPSAVGDFYYLRNLREVGTLQYTAVKKNVTIQNVIWAEGERKPAFADAQKTFRQAFVIVTKNLANANSFAITIDKFRRDFVSDFDDATGGRAQIDTRLLDNADASPPGTIEQIHARPLAIPDYVPGELSRSVKSELCFTTNDVIKHIAVAVDITHTYRGDLKISLIGPDGTEAVIHNREGGFQQDIANTYTDGDTQSLQGFVGIKARGNWTLSISDMEAVDKGTLNKWGLKLEF